MSSRSHRLLIAFALDAVLIGILYGLSQVPAIHAALVEASH